MNAAEQLVTDTVNNIPAIYDAANGNAPVADIGVDAAGRMIQYIDHINGASFQYDFDAKSRLLRASPTTTTMSGLPPLIGSGVSVPGSATFDYDDMDNLIATTTRNGVTSAVWGRDGILEETQQGSAPVSYARAGSLVVSAGGTRLMHDGMGSVTGQVGIERSDRGEQLRALWGVSASQDSADVSAVDGLPGRAVRADDGAGEVRREVLPAGDRAGLSPAIPMYQWTPERKANPSLAHPTSSTPPIRSSIGTRQGMISARDRPRSD